MAQGWECPKCGATYAPWVESCTSCKSSSTRVPNNWPYDPGTNAPYVPYDPYRYPNTTWSWNSSEVDTRIA